MIAIGTRPTRRNRLNDLPLRTAMYSVLGRITLSTITFDRPIELADFARTRFPGFSLAPAGEQGAVVAMPPRNGADLRTGTVIWQPRPDVVVTASGPPGDVDRIADSLTLSDLASADLAVMNIDPVLTGEPDLTVLDETSEGRFADTQRTQSDGTVCTSFTHNRYGGGGGGTNRGSCMWCTDRSRILGH